MQYTPETNRSSSPYNIELPPKANPKAKPSGYDLEGGQLWERYTADVLRSLGQDIGQPNQCFIPRYKWVYDWRYQRDNRRVKSGRLGLDEFRAKYEDRSLMPSHQVDLIWKTPSGKVRLLEVKSRYLSRVPDGGYIWVSPVHRGKGFHHQPLLLLVDQATGLIHVCPDQSAMAKLPNSYGQMTYSCRLSDCTELTQYLSVLAYDRPSVDMSEYLWYALVNQVNPIGLVRLYSPLVPRSA